MITDIEELIQDNSIILEGQGYGIKVAKNGMKELYTGDDKYVYGSFGVYSNDVTNRVPLTVSFDVSDHESYSLESPRYDDVNQSKAWIVNAIRILTGVDYNSELEIGSSTINYSGISIDTSNLQDEATGKNYVKLGIQK